jgi:hypothetical protein
MGWDKNTIVTSAVDGTIEVLKSVGIAYTLTELGHVTGCGLNDDDHQFYPIRKLEYKAANGENITMLEQMQRTHDCDLDDHLISCLYEKEATPQNWPLEVYITDYAE